MSSRHPRFQYQRLESIAEHEQPQLQAEMLLSARRLADFDEGLAEQLNVIKDLPVEEQFDSAYSLLPSLAPASFVFQLKANVLFSHQCPS